MAINYTQALEEEEKKLLAGNQETPLVVSEESTGSYVSPYAQQIEEALGKVQNSTFEYNQAEDPSWQAMRKQYLLDAERSMKDVMGQAAAATGGRASTAAISAASQAADYYKSQLNAQQQTLYQAAYERYYNQFTQELNKLSALQQQDATAYQQYLDEKNAALDAEQREYERGIYEKEQAEAARSTAYERLVTLIMNTGYSPSAEELTAAGMSASEAKSWAQYYADQKALASSSGSSGYSYSSGGSSGNSSSANNDTNSSSGSSSRNTGSSGNLFNSSAANTITGAGVGASEADIQFVETDYLSLSSTAKTIYRNLKSNSSLTSDHIKTFLTAQMSVGNISATDAVKILKMLNIA